MHPEPKAKDLVLGTASYLLARNGILPFGFAQGFGSLLRITDRRQLTGKVSLLP
jgi:hypothetical protein